MKKYYGNDNFNLQNAYHDCKSVFENLTENNFQSADFGLVAYYANEIMYALEKALEQPQGEWIFRQGTTCGGYYKCNKCGEVERAEKNFCPNCGAKMKGGAE